MRRAPEEFDPARARTVALNCLARREYSSVELCNTLVAKGCARDLATQVIERLQAERLLSDDRFIENLISARQRRGQGPLRVRQELDRKGIPRDIVERWLDPGAETWLEVLRELHRRKFRSKRPATPAERAKQVRFLQGRGFSFDQIQQVLSGRDAS